MFITKTRNEFELMTGCRLFFKKDLIPVLEGLVASKIDSSRYNHKICVLISTIY